MVEKSAGGAQVSLLLQRQPVVGFAEPQLESKTVTILMHEYIQHIPQAAKPMGIRVENGMGNRDDVARVAADRLFVRIKPT